MTKSSRNGLFLIAGIAILVGGGVVYYRLHHQSPPPPKTVAQILKERADHAVSDLSLPLGKAILAKDWAQSTTLLKGLKAPHFSLANTVRALYIEGKITQYSPKDLDSLEGLILDWLAIPPVRDELGYGILVTQLFRLPLLGPESSSRKKLEAIARGTHASPNDFYEAQEIALSKLVMQGAPPAEKDLHRFETMFNKIDRHHWSLVVDSTRDVHVQDRLIQFTIGRWKSLKPLDQGQLLTIFSNAVQVPKDASLVAFSIHALQSAQDMALVESSLRYLSALNAKGHLTADQKQKIANSLAKIDGTHQSPFLAHKLQELLQELKK